MKEKSHEKCHYVTHYFSVVNTKTDQITNKILCKASYHMHKFHMHLLSK